MDFQIDKIKYLENFCFFFLQVTKVHKHFKQLDIGIT